MRVLAKHRSLFLVLSLSGCTLPEVREGATGRAVPPGAELAARTLDECLSSIRACTVEALGDASQTPAADPSAKFQGCVASSTAYDYDSEEDVSCAGACSGELGEEICGILQRAFVESAAKGAACVATFDGCMSSCRGEADNQTDGSVWDAELATDLPEAVCLYTGLERINCQMVAQSARACGGTFAPSDVDHAACMRQCDATTSPWNEEDSDEAEFCADPEAELSTCEYCKGQCEDVPDLSIAWQTIAELADQEVARGRSKTWEAPVPAGAARIRVVLTPATDADDPELELWAPGSTEEVECLSQNGPGEVDACVVEPLSGGAAVTPGAWRVVIQGAPHGGSTGGRHHYRVELQIPAPTPTPACVEAAGAAIERLEAVNGTSLASIGPFVLERGSGDHALIRVDAASSGFPLQYVVNAEPQGDRCLVYAVVRAEHSDGMLDDGETLSSRPSDACVSDAREVTLAVADINGWTSQGGVVELAAADEDRELLRVAFTRDGEPDSFLVKTATLSGGSCWVHGLQLRSQQTELAGVAAAD